MPKVKFNGVPSEHASWFKVSENKYLLVDNRTGNAYNARGEVIRKVTPNAESHTEKDDVQRAQSKME